MPVKTHKHPHKKKHPHHYAKVYWPYLPLVVILALGLWIGHSSVGKSQQGVLAYATSVSQPSLLQATNQQRIGAGKHNLRTNTNLAAAAQAKAEDMAKRNYWSHNTPDGTAPWSFIDKTTYVYSKAGENLAYGFATSKDTVTGWMNSPTHKENLLDDSYREVGFGIANASNYQGEGPSTIVVAMYATPLITLASAEAPAPDNPVQTLASSSPIAKEPTTKSISKAQTLTGGKTPWISFGIGLASGLAIAYLLLKHSWSLQKALRSGERFVLHHPVLDLTVISFVALSALLSQSVGFIR